MAKKRATKKAGRKKAARRKLMDTGTISGSSGAALVAGSRNPTMSGGR